MSTYVKQLPQLFDIAIELAAGLGTSERFGRLLSASMQVIPCDAAAVLKLQDHALHPVASLGLKREASSRRFQVSSG